MSSSASAHWCTPEEVLNLVYTVGDIALDPCSNDHSIVVSKRFNTPEQENGLALEWSAIAQEAGGGLVFVNPPYGREISKWVKKCVIESARGAEIIALVGARTETKWFQEWIFPTAQSVCFWKGRITFIDGTGQGRVNPAFFPSALC